MQATKKLPRPLTKQERTLTRVMIERGDAPAEEKARLLDQLTRATVVSHCPCGCASVNFAIDGKVAEERLGLHVVGDFVSGDDATLCGVFVFRCGELLSGIEVYSLSGVGTCRELPSPRDLRPFPAERPQRLRSLVGQ